jgi:hypothetical protein
MCDKKMSIIGLAMWKMLSVISLIWLEEINGDPKTETKTDWDSNFI